MGNPFTAAVRGKTAEFVSLREWLHGLLTFRFRTLRSGRSEAVGRAEACGC